jgi:hypothetical protein
VYFIFRITYWFIHHFNEFVVVFSLSCDTKEFISSIGKGNSTLKRWKIFCKITIFTLQLYLSINMSLSHENVIFFITRLCYKTKLFLVSQTVIFVFKYIRFNTKKLRWNQVNLLGKYDIMTSISGVHVDVRY